MSDTKPVAIHATDAAPRPPLLTYPEPLNSQLLRRIRQPLGDVFGLKNFGVNFTRMAPNAVSAPRHSHSRQDEFIYILEGNPVLITDAGETPLSPGMCTGFPAGGGDAHHLVNRTDRDVVYLEVGDRTAGDSVAYVEDYAITRGADGRLSITHKDGTPY